MENAHDLLKMPYGELPFDRNFKKFMAVSGFQTLEDMLKVPGYQLLEMKGFTVQSLFKLYTFLSQNGLEKFLKTS